MKGAANQTGGELWFNFLRGCQLLADGSDLLFPDRGAVSGGCRKLRGLVLGRRRVSCFRYRLLRLLVLLRLGLRVCSWFSCHGESCWSGRKEEGTRGKRSESAGSLWIDRPRPTTRARLEAIARTWTVLDRRIKCEINASVSCALKAHLITPGDSLLMIADCRRPGIQKFPIVHVLSFFFF